VKASGSKPFVHRKPQFKAFPLTGSAENFFISTQFRSRKREPVFLAFLGKQLTKVITPPEKKRASITPPALKAIGCLNQGDKGLYRMEGLASLSNTSRSGGPSSN